MARTDLQPRCGAWMPNAKEPCARVAGHRWEHRSSFALDNAYRAVTGRERPEFAYRAGEWVPR